VAGAGQGGSGAGGVAGGGGGRGGNGGSRYAALQAIFDAKCVLCHDPAHPRIAEVQTYVEMPLVASVSYDALVNQAAHETCGGVRVKPGDPEHSYLYRKVADSQPCDGERMPHRGMVLTVMPLPDADIATIRAWIADGAPR
jgi:hypothetical protein